MKSEIEAMVGTYENKEAKITAAKNSVKQATAVAHESIEVAMRNFEQVDNLEVKTHELQDCAKIFKNDASNLERAMYWRNKKLQCIICLVVTAVVLYIVVPIIIAVADD